MSADQLGSLAIVGIGPGRSDWCLPDVAERIASATDLVGYARYLDLVSVETAARRHRSGNRVEADRSALALDLAADGGRVVVVSSGDPGVFAMASAVVEQLDRWPDRWRGVRFEVLPGITAAQALASRVGAPLGHDFCVISLSDVLKPWELIERRLEAAAGADFVIALYNPASRHRPWQFGRAVELLAGHRDSATPVIVGRDVGRPGEQISVLMLGDLLDADIDMRTVIIVGSSTTRILPDRPLGASVYTPRSYGLGAVGLGADPNPTVPSNHATA
jgi:precorrin-2 C20-methyltransferase/precorrin-3B C17-methyltransferase